MGGLTQSAHGGRTASARPHRPPDQTAQAVWWTGRGFVPRAGCGPHRVRGACDHIERARPGSGAHVPQASGDGNDIPRAESGPHTAHGPCDDHTERARRRSGRTRGDTRRSGSPTTYRALSLVLTQSVGCATTTSGARRRRSRTSASPEQHPRPPPRPGRAPQRHTARRAWSSHGPQTLRRPHQARVQERTRASPVGTVGAARPTIPARTRLRVARAGPSGPLTRHHGPAARTSPPSHGAARPADHPPRTRTSGPLVH